MLPCSMTPELAAERLLGAPGRTRVVDDLLGALLDDDDLVEDGVHVLVAADLARAAWRRSRGGSSW